MELRQLTTRAERRMFGACLEKARATRGSGFRERQASQLGRAHLSFGRLYGLYRAADEPIESMLAGFQYHDLASFPQSLPKPDISHIPARFVLEGGELWSLHPGAGRIASYMAGAVAGILGAKAILLYSLYHPINLTGSYVRFGFENACEPVTWPYIETLDGAEMLVQPLILRGPRLEAYIGSGLEQVSSISEDGTLFQVKNGLFKGEPVAGAHSDPIVLESDQSKPLVPAEAASTQESMYAID
jgi:hypothetical protein